MNVQAVNHQSFVHRARPTAPQPPHGNTIDNPVTVSPDTDGASKTRGVIRNLESGHPLHTQVTAQHVASRARTPCK